MKPASGPTEPGVSHVAGRAGRLSDGTPYYAPLGELVPDGDDARVQCHLCGSFWRALPTHLHLTHGWTAGDYRVAFGLCRTRPLQAPDLSLVQSRRMSARIRTDARVKDGMAKGAALARSGELPRQARPEHVRSARPLERQRTDRASGSALGTARSRRFRAERDTRARALGHASLEDYLRTRYERDRARVADMAAELGAAEITVTADMDRAGIARRPQAERLAGGREVLRAGRERRRRALVERAQNLGFVTLAAYLTDRRQVHGWPREEIARELGLEPTPFALARTMAAEGVAGNPRAHPRRASSAVLS